MSAITIKQRILSALSMFWDKLKTTYVTSTASNAGDNLALAASAGYNLQQQINKLTTFSVQKVTVTIASNANYALINAPTVSGQRFVCWIGCATSGWLGSVFIPDMGSASTSVWRVSGSGNVDCYALYQSTV